MKKIFIRTIIALQVLGIGTHFMNGEILTKNINVLALDKNESSNSIDNSYYKEDYEVFEYKVNNKLPRYKTNEDAINKENIIGYYEVGGYYFFSKSQDGMINISMTKGEPGAWINPEENETVEDNPNIIKFGSMVYLNSHMADAFETYEDAKGNKNPIKKLPNGPYFVKEQDLGALKVANIKGEEYWIIANGVAISPFEEEDFKEGIR